jgi:hypothetical protein
MDKPYYFLHLSTKTALFMDKILALTPFRLLPSSKLPRIEDDYPQHPHLILKISLI